LGKFHSEAAGAEIVPKLLAEQRLDVGLVVNNENFQSISSSKTPGTYGRLPYLGIARRFEILPFNRSSAPVTRYRCVRLVALSSSGDKLA
jgi:hypothetical protein